jgi:hypothetical protein
MTGDRPVRFYEGLRLKRRGLLTSLQSTFESASDEAKSLGPYALTTVVWSPG